MEYFKGDWDQIPWDSNFRVHGVVVVRTYKMYRDAEKQINVPLLA